jgi:hypothetical protein
MTPDKRFGYFDPTAEFTVVWRHLPHWEQHGATYFITWRAADSLPRGVLDEWRAVRDRWLVRHQLDAARVAAGEVAVPRHLAAEYRLIVSERWESRLDECHGECLLKDPALARVVADSLLHFDGDRYVMGDFVVMPNHVHLLVCLPNEGQLRPQCRSWKKFTATVINKRLGRSGSFWQEDSFDHLVRSADEFEGYRGYIAENPVRARLLSGSYLHYRAPDPVTE